MQRIYVKCSSDLATVKVLKITDETTLRCVWSTLNRSPWNVSAKPRPGSEAWGIFKIRALIPGPRIRGLARIRAGSEARVFSV